MKLSLYLITITVSIFFIIYPQQFAKSLKLKKPKILISILARNKAHILPYTLSYLEKFQYPKNRISLWIRSDNNVDNTIEVLSTWCQEHKSSFFHINITLDDKSSGFEDETGIADWSPMRFAHIINLREEMLNYARTIWADYIFILDADALITNPRVLDLLIMKNKTVVAPLLKSDGMYSNFWAGMTSDYYYRRTDEYEPILQRQNLGCFAVPMVHGAVLVNLNLLESDFLTYNCNNLKNYKGPVDDIITFALSAHLSDIPMYVCNDEIYGFIMVPLENTDTFDQEFHQLTNLKLEILSTDNQELIEIPQNLRKFVKYPHVNNLEIDKIYMINLLKRPERRKRMLNCFQELGLVVDVVDAIDGVLLSEPVLNENGIHIMPGYKDPYHERPMKMGEVGCLLSHYFIWNEISEMEGGKYTNHQTFLILEDDVKFESYFIQKLKVILGELHQVRQDWDIVYLGRKILQRESESWVKGSNYLVYPSYSYWTIGYLLSTNGAKKLVDAKPLDNLIPVDEFLPIMFDEHPREDWKKYFPKRNLIALSAEPFLIFPTHYTNDTGYISDTEDSAILNLAEDHQEL